jgi:predicted alpha-1,2-mannosidase
VPFGLVQLSPDTRTQGWDACSGYHYSDTTLLGFSHTHLSGTGARALGQLLLLPLTGPLEPPGPYQPIAAERFRSAFSHQRERAEPGYYQVWLERYRIEAELTATARAGMHRYTFPASARSHILIDLVHGIGDRPTAAELAIDGDRRVTGYRFSDGWAKGMRIYFAIELSRPFTGYGLEVDGRPAEPGRTTADGREVRAHLDFPTFDGEQVVVRVGLSPTSVAEAEANLRREIPDWDFDGVRARARAAWNANLSRITVESPNPNTLRTFTTALYHTMLAPTLCDDDDGSYLGPDRRVHAASFREYSTFSLWDTFRAEHPLLTLDEPERVNDFVRSLLAFAAESPGHLLPMWPLDNVDTGCMIAYHAAPVIVDAYFKGFRGFDPEESYRAMRASALSRRNLQGDYQDLGYVPAVAGERRQAVSRTLEFAYDDWCISRMAAALGHAADAALFARRARSWRALYDPASGFFRARTAAGAFLVPFDPKAIDFSAYTEANAWQYAFFVPQDIPDLIRLSGGPAPFIARLDRLFDSDSDIHHPLVDVTGLVGQYSHGNEPDHHVAYLYALAGAPYKTEARVRQIQLTQYDDSPDGLPGNDDCGQISAWYVWSAIGLYPVNPAGGVYVIGSPLVTRATIRLDPRYYRGGTFQILAPNASRQNCYVQSATLDGRPLDRPWITQEEIARGGTLELDMGLLPNKAWGALP